MICAQNRIFFVEYSPVGNPNFASPYNHLLCQTNPSQFIEQNNGRSSSDCINGLQLQRYGLRRSFIRQPNRILARSGCQIEGAAEVLHVDAEKPHPIRHLRRLCGK